MVYLGEVPLYQIALWLIAFFVLMQHVVKVIVYFLIQSGITHFGKIPLKEVPPDSTVGEKITSFEIMLYDIKALSITNAIELGIDHDIGIRELSKLYSDYISIPNNDNTKRNGYIKDIIEEYKRKKRKEK